MPASDDPMRGPRLKIERANAHIIEATAVTTNLVTGDPNTIFEFFTEIEPDGTQESMKLRLIKCVPESLVTIVGDVVGNLRSALDHVVGQLALKNNAASTKFVQYPFAATRKELEGPRTKEKIKKLSPEAQTYLLGLETYKGGKGHLLWALNEMRQLDFHNGIVPVAAAGLQLNSSFRMLAGSAGRKVFSAPKTIAFDENNVLTILKYPVGDKLEGEFNVTLGVAFGNAEGVEGQPVTPTLQLFSDSVSALVADVEERFFKTT